jgi:DNA gyrase subunit A
MATREGTIKKTPLSAFENIRKTGIIAIKLDKNDRLRWVDITKGNEDVIIVTETSQAVRFNEKEVRPMGRGARGVRGIKLRKGDRVIGMDVADPSGQLVVITENGYGKRTDVRNFPVHHRGGIGIRAGVNTKKTGKTVDAQIITSDEDDLVVISRKGTIIRTPLSKISKIGRATQGVRIMRISDDDSIASISNIPKMKLGGKQENLGLDILEDKEKPKTGSGKKSQTKKSQAKKAAKKKVAPKKNKKPATKKKAASKSGFKVKKVTAKKSAKKPKSGFKVKKVK